MDIVKQHAIMDNILVRNNSKKIFITQIKLGDEKKKIFENFRLSSVLFSS